MSDAKIVASSSDLDGNLAVSILVTGKKVDLKLNDTHCIEMKTLAGKRAGFQCGDEYRGNYIYTIHQAGQKRPYRGDLILVTVAPYDHFYVLTTQVGIEVTSNTARTTFPPYKLKRFSEKFEK